jgi:hypothetical protein
VTIGIAASPSGAEDAWEAAAANGEQQRRALVFCWRLMQGWMQFADPDTGLIPRRLTGPAFWNAKDCAADNYPFLTLTAWFTEPATFDGPMHRILETEQRLCNRVDRLPDDYVFATRTFPNETPNMDDMIFGATEYVKDGLIPLTEWLGRSPWFDRMIGLVDDVWAHSEIDTEVGLLPSVSHEVAGEMMQSLSRLYWMTRNPVYRKNAFRLAEYFFVHHPPEKSDLLRFNDHGCEVILGLSEVYYLAAKTRPDLYLAWKPAMYVLLDRILEVGIDEAGLFYHQVNPVTGEVLDDERTDNWGYNYMAYAVVAELDGVARYRDAIVHALRNLPAAKDYPWERNSADGYADALEGCINLYNRYPVPEALEWAEYTAERLLAKQLDTGVVEGWHGDGNSARTLIMYALWKSQGAYVQPWRADLRVGAAYDAEGRLHIEVASDWDWNGRLHFDRPRHSEQMGIPEDYVRLNQFPEWFTVPEAGSIETTSGTQSTADLRAGIPAESSKGKPFRFTLYPAE